MGMSKTAMMELVEFCDRSLAAYQEEYANCHKMAVYRSATFTIELIKFRAEEIFMEREREQMIDFGIRCGMMAARKPTQLVTEGIKDIENMYEEIYKGK